MMSLVFDLIDFFDRILDFSKNFPSLLCVRGTDTKWQYLGTDTKFFF